MEDKRQNGRGESAKTQEKRREDKRCEEKRWEEKRREEEEQDSGTGKKGAVLAFISLFLAAAGLASPLLVTKASLGITGFMTGCISCMFRRKHRAFSYLAILLSLCAIGLSFFSPVLSFYGTSGGESFRGISAESPGSAENAADSLAKDAASPGMPEGQTQPETEAPDLKASVSYAAYTLPKELLFLFVNDSPDAIDIDGSIVFFDESGEMLSIERCYIQSLEPGERSIGTVLLPHDQEYNTLPYDRYEFEFNVNETSESVFRKNYGKEFSVTSNVGVEGTVLVMAENLTGRTFSRVSLACLYYRNGEVVGYSTNTLFDFENTAAFEFYLIRDENGEPLAFDNYEILVLETDEE